MHARRYYPQTVQGDDDEGHPVAVVTFERVDFEYHRNLEELAPARLRIKMRDLEAAHLIVENRLPVTVEFEFDTAEVRRGGPVFGDDVPHGMRRAPGYRQAWIAPRGEEGDD